MATLWRLQAPIESLIGVLICGLSTGYFFLVVSRIDRSQPAPVFPNRARQARRKGSNGTNKGPLCSNW